MKQTSIIGIDLAKYNFQLHGAAADGFVLFRKKLTRRKLLDFLASQPRCVVAMEACGGAHYWGRKTLELGHQIRLVPPIYVKPFVKRQKNDATDAEAINARRGHLAEFGVVAPQGPAYVGQLASALEYPDSGLPRTVREFGGLLLDQIVNLYAKIDELEKDVCACARQDEEAARLMTIPGIGPITAMALQAFAPPMESFRRGRGDAPGTRCRTHRCPVRPTPPPRPLVPTSAHSRAAPSRAQCVYIAE